MIGISIAILANFLFAVVAVMDKYIVSKTVLSPLSYAFYSGIFQIIFLVLIPIVGFSLPETKYLIIGIFAGMLFILALIMLYKAIKIDEASRIIPIVGGASSIFTFFLAFIILNERLAGLQIVAFLFFVLGGILMASRIKNKKVSIIKGLSFAIFAGFLFAFHYVLMKLLFLNLSFFDTFFIVQFGGFLGALIIILPAKNRRYIFEISGTIKKSTFYLAVPSKIFAILASVLIYYAIFISSVTIVNSIQAIEYVFILILAIILSKKLPSFYREQINKDVIVQKVIAIVLIGVGLVLLAK